MQTALGKQLCDNIVPLMVDATTEYLSEQCNTILERVIDSADSDKFANCIQSYVLSKCHKLLLDQSRASRYVRVKLLLFSINISRIEFENAVIIFLVLRSDIGEEVLVDCLKYMDSLLDKVSDHSLLDQLYSKNRELCQVIVFSANKRLSLGYVNRTLKLAVRFLQLGKFC